MKRWEFIMRETRARPLLSELSVGFLCMARLGRLRILVYLLVVG
jgi:hypothetical protein